MGLYASANLIYGIPLKSYDEDNAEPLFWWDEEEDAWRDVPEEHSGNLEIITFGEYDSYETGAILTSPRLLHWSADAFEPEPVEPGDPSLYAAQVLFDADDSLHALGAPESFCRQARWYLTASYR